ncbi:antigen WC1.1-like [Coturnix japonica]|uniref:antigen WC1.1-like n=1 Tax=Coturnix japonica TaxID=93934 RepID=UPI0013A5C6A1|nr:antigen WC1.1-like [Coturnix japonica]
MATANPSAAMRLSGVAAVPGVVCCSGSEELRLVDGGGRCAGRVEVKHEGEWGSVCSYNFQWGMRDASVVCRQLGCGTVAHTSPYSPFGKGKGRIWLQLYFCNGNEATLQDCPHFGWGTHFCGHEWDVGVICSGKVGVCKDAASEAVYEELDYNLIPEYQEVPSRTGSLSQGSGKTASDHSGDGAEESDLQVSPESPAQPQHSPSHGYDDAVAVPEASPSPHPGDDPAQPLEDTGYDDVGVSTLGTSL